MNTLKEMREKILDEMENIPRRPQETQSPLRELYWSKMMHNRGKNGANLSHFEIFKECLTELQARYPNLNFKYNTDFFNHPGNRY
jgi:flagellar biosynthesis regulator FlbT